MPLPTLLAAGATVALGADDPLLFGSQLAGQYATMRAAHELADDAARRAGPDVGARLAGPDDVRAAALADIDAGWPAEPDRMAHDDGPENPSRAGDPYGARPAEPHQPYGATAAARAAVRSRRTSQPPYQQPPYQQPYPPYGPQPLGLPAAVPGDAADRRPRRSAR